MIGKDNYNLILKRYINDLYNIIQQRNLNPHLSLNAYNTTKIVQIDEYTYQIRVGAPMYDKSIFKKKGIIVHNGKGSYAQSLDTYGGYSGKHKNFIKESIKKANETLKINCENDNEIQDVKIGE